MPTREPDWPPPAGLGRPRTAPSGRARRKPTISGGDLDAPLSTPTRPARSSVVGDLLSDVGRGRRPGRCRPAAMPASRRAGSRTRWPRRVRRRGSASARGRLGPAVSPGTSTPLPCQQRGRRRRPGRQRSTGIAHRTRCHPRRAGRWDDAAAALERLDDGLATISEPAPLPAGPGRHGPGPRRPGRWPAGRGRGGRPRRPANSQRRRTSPHPGRCSRSGRRRPVAADDHAKAARLLAAADAERNRRGLPRSTHIPASPKPASTESPPTMLPHGTREQPSASTRQRRSPNGAAVPAAGLRSASAASRPPNSSSSIT